MKETHLATVSSTQRPACVFYFTEGLRADAVPAHTGLRECQWNVECAQCSLTWKTLAVLACGPWTSLTAEHPSVSAPVPHAGPGCFCLPDQTGSPGGLSLDTVYFPFIAFPRFMNDSAHA